MNKASDEGSDQEWALTGLPLGDGPAVQVASGPTPGPWAFTGLTLWNPGSQGIVQAPDESHVCHVLNSEGRQPNRRDLNARLIAAAPELLQALSDALGFVEDFVEDAQPHAHALLAQMRAAIAKAEGR